HISGPKVVQITPVKDFTGTKLQGIQIQFDGEVNPTTFTTSKIVSITGPLVARNFSTGNNPRSVAAVDVNGDNNLDLVVLNSSDNTVGVLLGNGNGTFQAAQSFTAVAAPSSAAVSLAVKDLNGDGKPDLVVADSAGARVSVLLGNGNGTFQTGVLF